MQKNAAEARGYWEEGVKLGSAVAQNNLAILLIKGIDSNPDEIRGMSLLRESAMLRLSAVAGDLRVVAHTGNRGCARRPRGL